MDISHELDAMQIDDALFAEAYASLNAVRRSVLKKWIARFHLFWGRDRVRERSETICWDQGFTTTSVTTPLDWSVVVLSETFASPAQLLAVIMPMILSGTRHVFVARETTGTVSFPVPLLVAMELAGQENVLAAGAEQLAAVVETLPQTYGPWGKVFCLGEPACKSLARDGGSGMELWSSCPDRQAGVWIDPTVTWDLETIAWTLQGVRVHVGGAVQGDLPDDFTVHEESLEAFMLHDFGVLYLSHEDGPSRIPMVPIFGPGQEGGWLWPDITPGTFTRTTVIWHGNDFEPDEDTHGRT